MTPVELAVIFLLIAVVLFVADIFVPSHGIVSIVGLLALLAAIACGFAVSLRVGFISLATIVILSPFAIIGALKLWPKTPVGKRMTLAGVQSEFATSPGAVVDGLKPGDRGVTVTALRPIGVCELNSQRVEASSDRGVIPPGTAVLVVALKQRRPVVRPIDVPADAMRTDTRDVDTPPPTSA